MGLERQTSHITWVRWARALAGAGFQTLRFDFRGTGESTGLFRDFTFTDWLQDITDAFERLHVDDGRPTILCGLRIGALMAARAFSTGIGHGLLAWDPPDGGEAALMELLRRRLATDFMEGTLGQRATREEYVDALLSGEVVTVEGYDWTRRLWQEAIGLPLAVPPPDDPRPWTLVSMGRRQRVPPGVAPEHNAWIPMEGAPFWFHAPTVLADTNALFSHGLDFVREACTRHMEAG
jgi:pimeloyl-ACP methyl ester carboxylesterase